jgi:hypothetical protein
VPGHEVTAYNGAVTTDRNSRLRSFVRSTLGCGCPDEVLRSIRVTTADASVDSDTLFTRLDVGSTLLVYVIEAVGDPQQAVAALPAFIASGLVERDAKGFNRLRVVLAADIPEDLREAAERTFNESAPCDGRVHLHVVGSGDLPFE